MNELKRRFAAGGNAVMVHVSFNAPALIEYLGELGFDAVMLDCERTSATVAQVEEMARAARAAGITAIVRPESLDAAIITRYLDCRVGGIMVPHVEDAAMAREIVDIVRYAKPRDHDDILIVAMIESTTALGNLDAIMAVDGIDVLFLARVDLSKSMGLKGDKTHPAVRRAVDEAVLRIKCAGRWAGAAGDFDFAAELAAQDVRLIFIGSKSLLSFAAEAYRGRVAAGTTARPSA